jgi:hypothetical protein
MARVIIPHVVQTREGSSLLNLTALNSTIAKPVKLHQEPIDPSLKKTKKKGRRL